MAVIMCEAGMLGNQTFSAEGEVKWTQHHLHPSGKWGTEEEEVTGDLWGEVQGCQETQE